ncbi:MAG: ATP synthase F1 subunit delta [Lachnospiraceae bacterium]|nr:ATP synthase F1 subunit delta [Lachnospiraceae bacterium]
MTQLAINYGIVLYELNIPKEELNTQRKILHETEELIACLTSPIVSIKAKHNVIDKIFKGKFKNFLKKLCDYNSMSYIHEILKAYDLHKNEIEGKLEGELLYVAPPTETQLQEIKAFLCKKYNKKSVELQMKQTPELLGGFVIRTGNYEFDWSYAGRLKALQQKLVKK